MNPNENNSSSDDLSLPSSNEFDLTLPEAADEEQDTLEPTATTGIDPLMNRRSPQFRAFQERIVAHVHQANYRPVKPKVMIKQLDLTPAEERALRRAVKFLHKDGRVQYGSNHVVYPVAKPTVGSTPSTAKTPANEPTSNDAIAALEIRERATSREAQSAAKPEKYSHRRDIIVGIFRRTSRGTGYVRPTGTPRHQGREQDIFIAANKTGDAADGDKVAVRIGKSRGPVGKLSGDVLEILERETHRFVGLYDERGGFGYVMVDGRVFTDPISVGDASAKNGRPGDKVVIEMVRFPSQSHPGEAVIVEILGERGTPGVDTLSVIHEFGLPGEFPEHVLQDARHQAEQFTESLQEREDLTHDTIITIDPVDARDFDDAISLEKLPNGHWLLGAHIADVSHFVPLKSALDIEAKDRATSVYLPDRVIPMLPEIISNHLASLQPDRIRYTQSCFIEFTPEGVPVHAEVKRAAIKSQRRFAYEEVDQYLADRESWREKLTPQVWDLLGRMHELAMILRKRRLEHGSIELTLPEVKIDLDEHGKVSGAHLVENTVSHQIIEEFMLAANEAVARILHEAGAHFLRRIHGSPDPRKLKTLTNFVRELGVECESLESRFEIKRVVKAVTGSPQEHAVNYAVLRSMQKAVYSPEEQGHYALHSEHYCHFTSPIRRYPDLTIHRMLNALASGKKPSEHFDAQMLLGEHCSEREQRAADAERELKKLKLLDYLSHRVGTKMEAIVTGVEEFGLFAQGVELPAEGLIHIQSLTNDYYQFDRATHSLVGRRAGNDFRLGDRLTVEIARVDVDRRELDLRLVKRLAGSKISMTHDFESTTSQAPMAEKPLRRGKTSFQGKGRGQTKASGSHKPPEPEIKRAKSKKKKQRPGKRERKGKRQD
jgi:ribonuclease R